MKDPCKAVFGQVVCQLREMHRLKRGDTICVALSGGADSVCLLRSLLHCQNFFGVAVTAVHVNHHLRGEESDRDAAFCRKLCAELEVPLELYDVDVKAYAAQFHCSEELAARECRYAAFSKVQASWIATAHTASDNLETLLHRLVRGAALHGLTAIPPVNGRFLRPMLEITREQVEECLAELDQSYVQDSTNTQDVYTRNQIRHQIVPLLKKLNPSVERTVGNMIRSLRREDAYMVHEAKAAYARCHTKPHTLEKLAQLHPALQMRCLALLLEEEQLSFDACLLERLAVLAETGGRWNLSGQIFAVSQNGRFYIEKVLPEIAPIAEKVPLQLGKNILFPGYVLEATLVSGQDYRNNWNVHEKFANCCVDYDKIKGEVFLRPKKSGDRIRLVGRNYTSSVKKAVQEKVARERRRTVHLAEDAEGLLYVEGVGIAQRVQPDENTACVLMLCVIKESDT